MMLEIKHLSCGYGSKQVIKNISFRANSGEIISVLGANGSGKTTLLKAIVGLLPYSGKILANDKDIKSLNAKEHAKYIAYVPQSTNIPFEFDTLEVVLMGRFHTSPFGFDYSKTDKELALDALRQVGALDLANRIYKHLSGGEKQLVLLARALAQKSKIVVMDEPVTGLDLGNQLRLLDLMQKLKNDDKLIIQATHHPDHALRVSNSVVWIHKGEIISFGKADEVISRQRIREVYSIESEIFAHKNGLNFILPIGFEKKGVS